VKNVHDLAVSYTVESALAKNGFDSDAFPRRAALQGMNDCHGYFALAQIAGHRLAQNFLRGSEVEHIVDNLESHAEVVAVARYSLLLSGSGLAENCAQPHANRKQASRFPIDEIEMLIEADELAKLFHLQQFALNHLLR
jgi:hypothetical protein